MLTQILKTIYLLISVLVSLFIGGISIAGGHGHFNYLSLLAILILFSTVIVVILYNKTEKLKSLVALLFSFVAIGSYLTLIIDFFRKNVSDRFVEFHLMKWVMVLGLTVLLYLSIKKIQSHFSSNS